MGNQLVFHLMRVVKSIWFRPAAYALAALAAILFTPVLADLVPDSWAGTVNLESVETTLNILASSMLAVAIFALATMFSAFQAAAQAATPRARPLMTQDRTAQGAISTFVGAFLFSLLGLVGLTTNFYSDAEILVLFVLSLLLVAIVVATLISWIQRLTGFGGVEEAILAIEAATRAALKHAARHPALGAKPASGPAKDSKPVHAGQPGYVQSIDIAKLAEIANAYGVRIFIDAQPGRYVGPGQPLAYLTGKADDLAEQVRDAFVTAERRTFEADPRFGLIALSEIASRALSPAVNDPGTAISVLAAMGRLFCGYAAAAQDETETPVDGVLARPLDPEDLVRDAFRAIARDGAGQVEVGIRLQKTLAMLAAAEGKIFDSLARDMAQNALERATATLTSDADLKALKSAASA